MLISAALLAAALPFAQAWSDTGLIARDDDWSGIAGVVGHRGDGLTAAAGADPRLVVADGAATLVTPVTAVLPPAADDEPLVQLRVLTTNAHGQDEWVGIDDIDVAAS